MEKYYRYTCTQYDYIVIAIGLCGNAIEGVKAGNSPFITPKTHDCNSFLPGSIRRFKELMDDETAASNDEEVIRSK